MKRRQRGSGTIERVEKTLADGTVKVRYRARLVTPERRKSLGIASTPEAADVILEAARAEIFSGDDAPKLTLRAWGTRVLDRREAEGYRSVDDDRLRWKHIATDPIAEIPLESLTRRDVLEWLDRLCAKWTNDRRRKRKLSKGSIQNTLNLLRAALEVAVERQVIGSNPAAGVKVPKRTAPTEEPWTYLLLDEQTAIWNCEAIPEHHKLWMQIAVGTGLREGEQFNLHLRDVHIDGDEPEIVVRYGSKKAGPKSTRGKVKIRHVPLFGLGLRAMRAWLALLPSYCPNNPQGLVFPGPTGARRQPGKHLHVTRRDPETKKPVPTNPLPEYLAAAGIVQEKRHDRMPVRWHDLRHTCAAALVSGMWGRRWSLEEVKGLLGHESVTTTERYAHLAKSALKAAAAETVGPVDKPTQPKKSAARSGPNPLKSLQSHLRDLNPRPTVYEASARMRRVDWHAVALQIQRRAQPG